VEIQSKAAVDFGIRETNTDRFQAIVYLLLPCTVTAYWYIPVMLPWGIVKIHTVLVIGNFMQVVKNMLDTANQERT
jgi:hypothetical protein